MYWFVTVFIIIFSSSKLSEAKHEKKLPSPVIVGTVYCDTCFQTELSKPTHFIAGALVGVECKSMRSNPSFYKQVKTDTNGDFQVRLPFSISKHVNKIKNCSVKLIKSNEPYCVIAASATQSSLHLKTKNTKTRIFSAGYFTFKPQNQPNICNQKPTKNFNSRKFLPLTDPTIPNLPATGQIPNLPSTSQIPNLPSTGQFPNLPPTGQIPNLPPTGQTFLPPLPALPRLPPLPQLPPLPVLPGLPLFPPLDKNLLKPKKEKEFLKTEISKYEAGKDEVLPTNPQLPTFFSSPPPVFGFQFPPFSFRQPPNNLPTNPFGQNSPPSVNFPSIPNLNSPPGNFPTIPNLNSPPVVQPLQPPPIRTNPLPPFPFQPSPGFPGFPSATSGEKSP